MSDAGWHPDPFGRFDYRYFDGTQWSEKVSTAGVESTDAPVQSPTPPPVAPPPAAAPSTAATPPAPGATAAQPLPPPVAPGATAGGPPPGAGGLTPPPTGGETKKNLLPFLIAGGVGLLVLVLLIVVIGGGDGGGGDDGLGTEAFTLEGERAVFSKTFSVDEGQAFRVRVAPEGDWDPVIVLSAAEEDFADAVRRNGEFLSDISALSDVDLGDDDREILDSLFLSDTLEDIVSDSGELPDDIGRQVVLDNQDNGFEGEVEGIADISFFDIELRITVYDYDAAASGTRSGEIVIETTDESLDRGGIEGLFSDDELPDAFTDFLSDENFLSD